MLTNLKTGKVQKYLLEKDFGKFSERFGRSLIEQFARNDTFFLSFGYPYLSNPAKPKIDIWDVPHIGMAYLEGDSVKYISSFGYLKPKLSKDYIWKHPKVCYIPSKNEILFAYYWSDDVLVYDFSGNFRRKVKVEVEGFDRSQMYGTQYKSGCFGISEWDNYMQDSVLYFSQLGYFEPKDLYYRTLNYRTGDKRGEAGIIFFDENGKIHFEINGFGNWAINPEAKNISVFENAYDSSHYRIIHYILYEYPKEML